MKRYTYRLNYPDVSEQSPITVVVYAGTIDEAEDQARAIIVRDRLKNSTVAADLIEVAQLPPTISN